MVELFTNSGYPEQTLCSAASDLGLHCLPVTLLGVSSLHLVKTYLGLNYLLRYFTQRVKDFTKPVNIMLDSCVISAVNGHTSIIKIQRFSFVRVLHCRCHFFEGDVIFSFFWSNLSSLYG